MPWSKQTLALPANPTSVRQARDWVAAVLEHVGRPELVESARIAVSELVTNALLHAEPPLTVRVRGTIEHPRVEVSDQSMVPPRPRPQLDLAVDDDLTWSTIGRGLDLVGSHAVAWGADIDPRKDGKVVWFEPSVEPREAPVRGAVFDLEEALETHSGMLADPESMIGLDLLRFPVELFSHLRLHFHDLARELRLLAISNPDRYPVAVAFAETYLQVEHERRQAVGLDALERAISTGQETVDLHYVIPPEAPTTMARIQELLDDVYGGLVDETLLAMKPPEELIALQRWYLGEFVRQAEGETPDPWRGPTRLPRRREVS